jgi:hypothetical protein
MQAQITEGMAMNSASKRLLIAFVVLTGCGLILAYAAGLLTNKNDRGDENDHKAANGVNPVPAIPSASSARDQVSSGGGTATNQYFTGRAITNEDALKLADSVVVGTIVDLGNLDAGAAGQTIYAKVKVEVSQTIKGTASKAISLILKVQKIPVKLFEETPKVGNEYIFFVQRLDPKTLEATKLLQATEENLSSIGALARSPGKKN